MYLIGAEHENKVNAQRLLERCVAEEQRLVTDVEVLQEILHRYSAIERKDAIQPAFEALLGVVDEVIPIEFADVERARDMLLSSQGLSARDVIHLSVMERHRITTLISFDSGFDRHPGIRRLHKP